MSGTASRLIALAARRFGADPARLTPDGDMFDALGIDSLRALELLSEVEIEFDIEIPDYELQGITTFEQLAGKIDERI